MTGLEWAVYLGLALDPSDGLPEPRSNGFALWYDNTRDVVLVSAAANVAVLAHVLESASAHAAFTIALHRGIITHQEAHAWWAACAGGAVLASVYRLAEARPDRGARLRHVTPSG
jgi:hypothetical protein